MSGEELPESAATRGGPGAYEIDEPERGIMMARDLARPGIVVTREYTVETERRREDKPDVEWNTGQPMRINWDEMDIV